jgi:hypothetical protein
MVAARIIAIFVPDATLLKNGDSYSWLSCDLDEVLGFFFLK